MATRPKSIVPIIGESDIGESYIRQQDSVLLATLLIDRTMTAEHGYSKIRNDGLALALSYMGVGVGYWQKSRDSNERRWLSSSSRA